MDCPSGSVGKESACNAWDPGLIPQSGRSPGEAHGNPLRYSCQEKSIDKEAWQATVHGVTRVKGDWDRTQRDKDLWRRHKLLSPPPYHPASHTPQPLKNRAGSGRMWGYGGWGSRVVKNLSVLSALLINHCPKVTRDELWETNLTTVFPGCLTSLFHF